MSRTRRRSRLAGVIAAAAVLSLALGVGVATAQDEGISQPIDFVHNVSQAPAPVTATVFSNGPKVQVGRAICTTATSNAANVVTDCDGSNPHNETSIAVNPRNGSNIIGGLNDYQLSVNPGGHIGETIHSRAHVTFDGGRTWSEYPLWSNLPYQATGDPAVAFDASGHAYYATLGFRFLGPANVQSPDVLVSNSGNGGRTWSTRRVATGTGNFGSAGDVLDKEYITAWGSGNALLTWDDFKQGPHGSVISVRIFTSVTHNFGATWSAPRLVSGNLTESFAPYPVHTADGRVFVAFLNTVNDVTGRDDYEVVEVSPTTGARVAGPFTVGHTIDGLTDYPFAFGSPTYHDSLFRSWASGNIATDPTNGAHLAVIWSDMRNSPRPAPRDPYAATTNSDIVVSQSFNHGRTWSAPRALARTNDQWMPWGVYDTAGKLRIGFFDRHYDSANHRYGYTLATESSAGSLTFSYRQLTTGLSGPTRDNRWFAATVKSTFPNATTF
ncbi:MAG: sialidase family protein, partial [Chloroflexota bacterium]